MPFMIFHPEVRSDIPAHILVQYASAGSQIKPRNLEMDVDFYITSQKLNLIPLSVFIKAV